MFSAVENDFIKSFVSAYFNEGYKYYIVHTVTETGNDYDLRFIFSKEDIQAVSDNDFVVVDAVVVDVDTSSRSDNYNQSIHSRETISQISYSGAYEVNVAEFVYTNATPQFEGNTIVLNGDILASGTFNVDMFTWSFLTVFMLVLIFIYMFVSNIFNRK